MQILAIKKLPISGKLPAFIVAYWGKKSRGGVNEN